MTIVARLLRSLDRLAPAAIVSAHCDGPCGVYDPASARIAAEAVLSMSKKLLDMDAAAASHDSANTYGRYVAIKEEESQKVKDELGILWSDYFKPEHLEAHPDLHTAFWSAIKAASATKTSVSVEASQELLNHIESIHNIFWSTKGREVPWVLANP